MVGLIWFFWTPQQTISNFDRRNCQYEMSRVKQEKGRFFSFHSTSSCLRKSFFYTPIVRCEENDCERCQIEGDRSFCLSSVTKLFWIQIFIMRSPTTIFSESATWSKGSCFLFRCRPWKVVFYLVRCIFFSIFHVIYTLLQCSWKKVQFWSQICFSHYYCLCRKMWTFF